MFQKIRKMKTETINKKLDCIFPLYTILETFLKVRNEKQQKLLKAYISKKN